MHFVVRRAVTPDTFSQMKTPPVLAHERGFDVLLRSCRQADHSGAVQWGAMAHGVPLPSLRPDIQSAVVARLSIVIAGGVMLFGHPPVGGCEIRRGVAAATDRRSALTSGAAS